jgi:hypothetical protein
MVEFASAGNEMGDFGFDGVVEGWMDISDVMWMCIVCGKYRSG